MARAATSQPSRAWALAVSACFGALLVWSWRGTGVDLGSLFSGEALRQIAVYVGKLFPPDLSAVTLREAGTGAVETFAISLVGSLLSICIALPLSVLATRTFVYRGLLFEGGPLGPGCDDLTSI